MSPSDAKRVPPEVLAIAVALAVEWQAAEAAEGAAPEPASPWRWSGRQHRWS
jgi:hypothetical protein